MTSAHSRGDYRLLVVVGFQGEGEASFHDPADQVYASGGHDNGEGHAGPELARGPGLDLRLKQRMGGTE